MQFAAPFVALSVHTHEVDASTEHLERRRIAVERRADTSVEASGPRQPARSGGRTVHALLRLAHR